jgi:cytochrome P450 family 4
VANKLEKVVGEETCLTPYLCSLAFNVITETAFGVKIDGGEVGANQYRSNINKASEMMMNRLVRPWLYNDFVYRMLGYEAQAYEVVAPNNSIITDIMKKRRLMFDVNKNKVADAGSVEDTDDNNV